MLPRTGNKGLASNSICKGSVFKKRYCTKQAITHVITIPFCQNLSERLSTHV